MCIFTLILVTVLKEQEDARLAMLLKETIMLTSTGDDKTQPSTSEEGVAPDKSGQVNSDIVDIKQTDGSEVNERETPSEVDISKKDGTSDSTEAKGFPGQPRDIIHNEEAKSEHDKADETESNSEAKSPIEVKLSPNAELLNGYEIVQSDTASFTTKAEAGLVSKSDAHKIENSATKESSSSISSSNISKELTTTPSEFHPAAIDSLEHSTENKPAGIMTPDGNETDKTVYVTPFKVDSTATVMSVGNDREGTRHITSPSDNITPLGSDFDINKLITAITAFPTLDKDEKIACSAAAMVTDSSIENNPSESANENQKLTQEQLDSLFVKETQESLLGLVGAMLPKDSKVGCHLLYMYLYR